jgi:hypothetical protein
MLAYVSRYSPSRSDVNQINDELLIQGRRGVMIGSALPRSETAVEELQMEELKELTIQERLRINENSNCTDDKREDRTIRKSDDQCKEK